MLTLEWQIIETNGRGPGPRSRHGLVYDSARDCAVLFGGVVWVGSGQLKSDTWELRDGEWIKIKVPALQRPPSRHRGAMVFDAKRGVSVLFGGQADNGSMLADTWTYGTGGWRRVKSWWWNRPRPRCGHALAYDENTGNVVMFGGAGSLILSLRDTWIFDGSRWRQIDGPGPSARRYSAFAYSPELRGCVLHGGSADDDGKYQFGESWLFRDGAWSRLSTRFDTEIRDDHGFAYHRTAERLIMLDGIRSDSGILAASLAGWESVYCPNLQPSHQCAPLAWHAGLDGLLLYGGEAYHGGPQSDTTAVLKVAIPD